MYIAVGNRVFGISDEDVVTCGRVVELVDHGNRLSVTILTDGGVEHICSPDYLVVLTIPSGRLMKAKIRVAG